MTTARKWADTEKGRAAAATPGQAGASSGATRAKGWGETEKGRSKLQQLQAQSPVGARRWQPKIVDGGASSPPAARPAPAILPALTLKPGSRPELRRRLEVAFAAASAFAILLFDSLFHEPEASSAPSPAPAPEAKRRDAAALGLKVAVVDIEGGPALQIVALDAFALAAQRDAKGAKLELGDLITRVDDFIPSSPADLDKALEAGLWESHMFYVRRGGEELRVAVQTLPK